MRTLTQQMQRLTNVPELREAAGPLRLSGFDAVVTFDPGNPVCMVRSVHGLRGYCSMTEGGSRIRRRKALRADHHTEEPIWRSTTILTVRHKGKVALGGDGQVSYGNTIMKADTRKIRWILENKALVGFAGSTADAFALLERFEARAKDFPGNITRAATELARDWRTDRVLRRLEAMMVVVNDEFSLLITGQGDVVQPSDSIIGIGSGGQYAQAAARALIRHSKLSASEIVRESLLIASEIDVFTNDNIVVEEFSCAK